MRILEEKRGFRYLGSKFHCLSYLEMPCLTSARGRLCAPWMLQIKISALWTLWLSGCNRTGCVVACLTVATLGSVWASPRGARGTSPLECSMLPPRSRACDLTAHEELCPPAQGHLVLMVPQSSWVMLETWCFNSVQSSLSFVLSVS